MSALREALHGIAKLRSLPLRLPLEPLTQKSADSLTSRDESVELRPAKDYDRVAGHLLAKVMARNALSRMELRDGAWCLWETKPALAERRQTLDAVLDGIVQAGRGKPYRALASSYLRSFDPNRAGMEEAARVLKRGAPQMGRFWPGLELRFGLFDIDRGPRTVASEALRGRIAPSETLKRVGLTSTDARSGFTKVASAESLLMVRQGGVSDALDRLRLCEQITLDEAGRLIFDEHGALLVQALIEPFGSEMPPKHVRDPYLDLLIRLFGDPRVAPGRWVSMRPSEERVRRWLTEQSLRQFLEIIGKVADPSMWVPRRKFWNAVHRAELIRDAWVIFDNAGAAQARKAFGKHVAFGTFSGTVASGQAVLLMKIGGGIVAEWSHNGRCNIWRDALDPSAPQINQQRYDPSSLRGLDTVERGRDWTFQAYRHDPQSHQWRGRVANRIRDMTQFVLDSRDYQ